MTIPHQPDQPVPTPEQIEAARISPEDRERAAIRWEKDTSAQGKNLLDADGEEPQS